MTNNKVNRR